MDEAGRLSVDDLRQFEEWLAANGALERLVWVVIFKKASKKQIVTFDQLLEVALCHGWVDVQTKRIDEDRYAIRFTPRKPGGAWSPRNRETAQRLLANGKLKPAGLATLPDDLGVH